MDKITVFDLKKLGLITNDADDIFVVTEINKKLEDGDILGAFDMVAHVMDLHVESLKDQIDDLEDYLNALTVEKQALHDINKSIESFYKGEDLDEE